MKRRFPQGVTLAGQGCIGITLLLLAFTASGQGNVVKCVDASGNITYQDSPCIAGQAGRVYRKVSYGPLLDVFLIDMRSYRDSSWNRRDDRGDTCIEVIATGQSGEVRALLPLRWV